MSLREERDPAFWLEIASHPSLRDTLMGLAPADIAEIAVRPNILPLASANGGFFFGKVDGLGMVLELHSLFRPEGWGREAAISAKQALQWVFRTAQAITTYEVQGNAHSRPPVSYGFVKAGEWQATDVGMLRLWVLTRAAWDLSPSKRRRAPCP